MPVHHEEPVSASMRDFSAGTRAALAGDPRECPPTNPPRSCTDWFAGYDQVRAQDITSTTPAEAVHEATGTRIEPTDADGYAAKIFWAADGKWELLSIDELRVLTGQAMSTFWKDGAEAVEAIRVFKRHDGTFVEVHVQLAGEDGYRLVWSEEVVEGIAISHEVLPGKMRSSEMVNDDDDRPF